MNKSIDTFFITGFLGSGKTTLLNQLLDQLCGKKTGVIVNEFGQVGVDKTLIPENEFGIVELNNGQIFCSCLVGNFVKAMIAYSKLPIDYLLVETSGLALPSTLNNVLETVEKHTSGRINYRGMTCVVDTVEFPNLIDVLKPVEEQIITSRIAVINKTDLADASVVTEIEKKLKEINPGLMIYKTSYGAIPIKLLTEQAEMGDYGAVLPRKVTAAYSRPETCLIRPSGPVPKETLRKYLCSISCETYRIKGFLDTGSSWVLVDTVGTNIQIKDTGRREEGFGALNIILKSGKALSSWVMETWNQLVEETL